LSDLITNPVTEYWFSNFAFRLGSVPYDGLARLCGHSGLEHILHYASDGHSQAENMRGSAW